MAFLFGRALMNARVRSFSAFVQAIVSGSLGFPASGRGRQRGCRGNYRLLCLGGLGDRVEGDLYAESSSFPFKSLQGLIPFQVSEFLQRLALLGLGVSMNSYYTQGTKECATPIPLECDIF